MVTKPQAVITVATEELNTNYKNGVIEVTKPQAVIAVATDGIGRYDIQNSMLQNRKR